MGVLTETEKEKAREEKDEEEVVFRIRGSFGFIGVFVAIIRSVYLWFGGRG